MTSFCPDFTHSVKLTTAVTAALLMNACAGGSSPSAARSSTGESVTKPDDGRRFSIQLGWTIPLARANGDVLYMNELTGYEIVYSNQADTSPQQLHIDDPLQTEIDLRDLPAGQYRFAIAAIDESGLYSSFSTPVEITLD